MTATLTFDAKTSSMRSSLRTPRATPERGAATAHRGLSSAAARWMAEGPADPTCSGPVHARQGKRWTGAVTRTDPRTDDRQAPAADYGSGIGRRVTTRLNGRRSGATQRENTRHEH